MNRQPHPPVFPVPPPDLGGYDPKPFLLTSAATHQTGPFLILTDYVVVGGQGVLVRKLKIECPGGRCAR